MRVFEVGGSVRDRLILGVPGQDFDFCVEAESLEALINSLESDGVNILHRFPERLTVKAQMPLTKQVKDFVLCRTNEVYDNYRLISAEPGTLFQDMIRRDFTINAIARDVVTGKYWDFFGGLHDCEHRILKTVGNPSIRLREDPRRILRGIRFMVECGLTPDTELKNSLEDVHVVGSLTDPMFKDFSVKEINKCFRCNPLRTMEVFTNFPMLANILFTNQGQDLNLTVNSKEK